MKLPEHVELIRIQICKAFDNQFSRLGVGPSKMLEIDKITSDLHSKREKIEILIQNHTGETGTYQSARDKALDELTFTLFNRLAALKVMEAHQLFHPIITRQAEHGDRSYGHKAWLEKHPEKRHSDLEGFRDYLKDEFNSMGESIPLYHKNYPYALLPGVIELNEIIDAFNQVEKDSQIDDNIWLSDDILGWLYESYNNTAKQKHKDDGGKTEYNKVSLQSQWYTPRWVVEFLVNNSLGKLYLEMFPDSAIKNRYKIANAPSKRIRDPQPLPEIKLIDPAAGSGNFLLYAFDFFYDLYIDQIENYDANYKENDIPNLIIENNIHGIDLDDRAIQLGQLGLWIKARRKNRNIGLMNFNLVSSDFYLPDYQEVKRIFEESRNLDSNQKNLISDVWADLQLAYKFGSLIKIDEKVKRRVESLYDKQNKGETDLFLSAEIAEYESFEKQFFKNLEMVVKLYAKQQGNSFLTDKTKDAITFLKILTTRYEIAVANPPYIDSRDYGDELREFLDLNYRRSENYYKNLFAVFIKRTSEFVTKGGKFGLIHPRTFMFLSSFEDSRNLILNKFQINIFVDYGLSNLFGSVMVDPCFYIIESSDIKNEHSIFIGVDEYTRTPLERFKKEYTLEALSDFIESKPNKHLFLVDQKDFRLIDSHPFIFWISDSFRHKFKFKSVSKYFAVCNGISSGGNNEQFYRFWWEIYKDDILFFEDEKADFKWVFINKGGEFNKWYGNLWLVFEWANNGKKLKNLKKTFPSIRYSSEEYYYKEGLAFSGSSTKGLSVRYQPSNCIFERSGKSIFPLNNASNIWYLLSLLNSNLAAYIVDSLNPTVSFQSGDIERIPYVIPNKEQLTRIEMLTKTNVNISRKLLSYSLYEPLFKISPILLYKNNSLKERIHLFLNYKNHLIVQTLINEAILNKEIIDIYELTNADSSQLFAKTGRSIGALPLVMIAKKTYLNFKEATEEFLLDNIQDFIENLPTKEFSPSERENIENEFPYLYQSSNDLEEFCIRHQINPINVWYWFKESKVIPKQHMNDLGMEFKSLLVPNAGEKLLLDRVEEKFMEKGFSMAQYSSFDSVLGRELNDYLNHHFFRAFSDHLNLFMYLPKTPFIWHLASGPEQGFDCYIIIYKWSRDKLMRIRSVYIENRERALMNRQSDLSKDESAGAQNEKDKIYKQLKEIESFKQKIDELLEEGYNPILDDGVGKNIAPLQKKQMLAYEVLNTGQLKKYLNADW